MNLELFDFLADVMILVAWPATVLFIVFYGTISPWKVSLIGRSVMYFALSMFALLSLGISTNWIHDYDYEPIVRFVVYGGVTATLWRLFYSLRLAQTGRISVEHMNHSPFKDAYRKILNRLTKNK